MKSKAISCLLILFILLGVNAAAQNPLEMLPNTEEPKQKKDRSLPDGHYKGVRGGVAMSFSQSQTISASSLLVGPSAAVFYQYYKQRFLFMAELGFLQKGLTYKLGLTDDQGNSYTLRQAIRYNFIEVPILLGVRIKTFNIFGGITNGITLSGNVKHPSPIGTIDPISYELELDQRYEAGALMGISKDFTIARKYAVLLDVRYNVGLNKPQGARMQYVSVSTGFKF